MSRETTFPRDLCSHDVIGPELVALSDSVASRLRAAGVAGRTVTVKVRFGDFSTITRSHTVAGPVDSGVALAREAKRLLSAVDVAAGVRLIGVGVSELEDSGQCQLALDLEDQSGESGVSSSWHELDRTIDRIRGRFGAGAIQAGAGSDAGAGGTGWNSPQ